MVVLAFAFDSAKPETPNGRSEERKDQTRHVQPQNYNDDGIWYMLSNKQHIFPFM
jgi:hypothetical protein